MKQRQLWKKNFTLVELLVVMSIMVVLYALTIPALIPAQSKQNIDGAARELKATLYHARSLAARYNRIYCVVFHNASSYSSWVADKVHKLGDTIESGSGRKIWKVIGVGNDNGTADISDDWGMSDSAMDSNFSSASPTSPFTETDYSPDTVTWELTTATGYAREGDGVWYAISGPNPDTGRFPQVDDYSGPDEESKLNQLAADFVKILIGKKHRLPEGVRFNMGTNWDVVNESGSGSKVAFGKYGDLRIQFMPSGRAIFRPASFDGKFILRLDGSDAKIVIEINKYTGLPTSRPYDATLDVALTDDP